MGRIREGARKLAVLVAGRVARNELFEQPGERAPASALPPVAAARGADPAEAPRGGEADEALCRQAGLAEIKQALGPGSGPRVVNHWATWCAPCVEELPHLRELAAALPAGTRMVGLSWDLFDPRGDAPQVEADVAAFAARSGLSWSSLLVTAPAEEFFAAYAIEWQKIPQTWVLGADGAVLRRFEGVVDGDSCAEILSLLQETAS